MNNECWLAMLRGRIEKNIDQLLSSESIKSCREMFEAMEPAVKNPEDAIVGYVLGNYIDWFYNYVRNTCKRRPTQMEEDEAANVISRRIVEIKSRIYETNQ